MIVNVLGRKSPYVKKADKENVPGFFFQSSYENNWEAVKITINLGKLVKKLFGFISSKNQDDSWQ